jgi:hypothetical protein
MIRRLIILLLIVGCVFADVISVTGFRNNTSNSDTFTEIETKYIIHGKVEL